MSSLKSVAAPTVLVVEDEDSIRMLVQYSLESRGYRVLVAGDGAKALQLAEDYAHSIDILITDLLLPGLGGTQLAQKIHATRPSTKILLMSGNAEPLPEIENGSMQMLPKPFSQSQLLDTVKSILK